MEGIDREDIANMLFLLPYAIMSHQNLDGDGAEQYVDEVIAMADGHS